MASAQTSKEHFSDGLAKVLAEKWQVDVRLKAVNSDEGSVISAHKVILASRSEVLKNMLESNKFKTSAKKVETITLSDMKQEELEAFVEFIYSDGSILSVKMKQHVRALYLAADKYKIPQLRDLCRSELISSLNLINSLDVLDLAQIPFDKVLNDSALSYIKTNGLMFASFDEFKLLAVSNSSLVEEILKAYLPRRSRSCSNCSYINHHNQTDTSCYNCGFDYPLCS